MDPQKSDQVGRRSYNFGHSSPRVRSRRYVDPHASEMEDREEDGLTGLVSCLGNNTAPARLEVNISCKYVVGKEDARLVQDALALNTTVTDLSLVNEPYRRIMMRRYDAYLQGITQGFSRADTCDLASAIFKGLQKNTSLTRLKSVDVGFGDVAGKLLADVLKNEGCSLREIELHHGDGVQEETISTGTIGAFATTLPCNTTLKTLKLDGCSWRQTADDSTYENSLACFEKLSKTLSLSPALTDLDIRTVHRHRFMGGEAECGLEMVLIADGLCTNTRLRALSLFCPSTNGSLINPGVGRAFAKLMELNTTLTKLKLYDINARIFTSAGIQAITRSLFVNTTIEDFHLLVHGGSIQWTPKLAGVLRAGPYATDQDLREKLREVDFNPCMPQSHSMIIGQWKTLWRDKLAAFAMGMIPRLGGGGGEGEDAVQGEGCRFHHLPSELFEDIGKAYWGAGLKE